MTVIDASVWVSFLKEDDTFHELADNILQSLVENQERISIPAIAFSEVAGAIRRREKNKGAAKDAALNAVRKMRKMELEVLANFDELEPVATEIAAHYSIKGADACYYYSANTYVHLHRRIAVKSMPRRAIRRRELRR